MNGDSNDDEGDEVFQYFHSIDISLKNIVLFTNHWLLKVWNLNCGISNIYFCYPLILHTYNQNYNLIKIATKKINRITAKFNE